jgi:CubicO group peptidase (beta-lactamase class C family)
MLLSEGQAGSTVIFSPNTVSMMHTNQIADLGESTALGWELNWPLTMGEKISDQAFGKTGFTGCSVVIDPLKKAAVVHLSNRIYPQRPASRNAINEFRRNLANLVFEGLEDQAAVTAT